MASLFLIVGTAWADISTTWTNSSSWVTSGFTTPSGVTSIAGSKTVAMLTTPVEVTASTVTVSFTWSGGSCALNVLGVDLVNRTTKEVVKTHYLEQKTGGDKNTITYTLSDLTVADGYMLRYFAWYSNDDRLNDTQGSISIVGANESDFVIPFTPTSGTMYALQEVNSGLYLNIQTLGINEPNQSGTNNISLNANPCIVYFEQGTTDNTKWTLKNATGTYAMQASGTRDWNASIGSTAYEWISNAVDTDIITIARADGKYIGMDTPTNGAPLYCDRGTALQFKLVPYSDLNRGVFTIKSTNNTISQGAIQSSAALNAITTATKIVIKNRASDNSRYLAGTSNQENIENAVLVWEPVTEGVAGEYYLRTTDAENGYFQKTASQANVTLGTKENAQKFYTTAPTSTGTNSELCDAIGNLSGADTDNLVRFVQEGGTTWLNCQGAGSSPKLGNSGKGVWTVHNVYLVTDATYLSLTASGDTKASFQATPTEFYVTPSADGWFIEDKDNAGTYVGSTHDWNTTTDFSLWKVLAPNNDGYAQIARYSNNTQFIGSNQNTNVGTGIFTNVGSDCNAWAFNGTFDYTTAGTETSGKYHFTSEKMWYPGACNKIRFTLTESGAFYQGGAKRMSFDSFTLYDANGNEVELQENNFSGNNNKTYAGLLDGLNAGENGAGCCCAAWSAGTEDDYFEILLPYGVDLGGAFSFSFVTENTTMNAKAFQITTSYEKVAEYTFTIEGNGDNDVTVTHNEETLTAGSTVVIGDFDADLVSATEISGYTWSIVIDHENATIKLVYTEAEITENPQAVVDLVNRIGGEGTDAKFTFVLDPSINSKQEVFVIGSEDNKILIKGTTKSALTTGLGWYLNNIAKINIAWNSLNEKTVSQAAYADLSNIPVPTAEETHVSDAKYRYYLNTCTFGYSMTSWTWKRWQQEIDWMALHGINMPLQLVGLEEVWRSFLTMEDGSGNRKYGYTDAEAKAFVAGPAFIPWWAMNNLEGWGGTAEGTKSGGTWAGAGGVQDDAWYTRQKNLANQIVTRQRELGMQPVLPGWSGMVPTNFASKSGYATRGNGGNWAGDFVRPLLLNVSNANYAEIAADYYACLNTVMGQSQYYSMDPFHEGGGAGTMEDYEALYAAMEAAKPGSQWVIQQWQWSETQKYSLTAVPEGKLIVLDLFSDGSPAFDSYSGYAPQDAVFCAIPNFGGRSGLMGRLQNVTDNYFKFKTKYASIKGIGTAPEAIEQTPVTYDLIYQLPWMNGVKPDVAEWVNNYAVARYGVENQVTQEAWSLLRQGPLNYGADGIQGPVEDVWAARPNLTANKASSWGKTLNDAMGTYTKARQQMLIDAVYKLLSQEDVIGASDVFQSNYNYDLVEFGGAVMADYAYYLLKGIKSAKDASNTELYEARRNAFLALIEDVDAFKGTNLNFRLGKWTQEARDAAGEVVNPTSATADWYEYNNARTIVSTWSSPNTNLNDYSYRSWQGLMKDLYLPRWQYYFNNDCTAGEYGYFEWNWAHGMTHSVGQTSVSTTPLTEGQQGHTSTYTREPVGNTVESATELLNKYIIPVTVNGSTYYAYHCLDNDVSSIATIPAVSGQTVDLTPYFGVLTDISSFTSDVVSTTVTDLSKVAIDANAADGAHSAVITLNDGTTLTFYFSINPKYNGVYTINYKNGNAYAPVFVGYNSDTDNAGNVGYKLIAEGTYSADAVADKYFTIVPSGSGFTLSAQGKYLKSPNLSAWNHLMFSDNAAEAGAYVIEETSTEGVFKIHSTGSGINYVNDYNNLVFGNDMSDKENLSTFTLTEVATYPFTVTSAGMATLCLPFDVVMADGMYAYDFAATNIEDTENAGEYVCTMKAIASPLDTLKAGTPVIIVAPEDTYNLTVGHQTQGAKSSLAGSLLRGNFVKQTLTQSDNAVKFIFTKDANDNIGFYRMQAEGGTIAANKCWMEWNVSSMPADAKVLTFKLEDPTAIDSIIQTQKSKGIYDLTGRRLSAPQRGVNIINGKKVIL